MHEHKQLPRESRSIHSSESVLSSSSHELLRTRTERKDGVRGGSIKAVDEEEDTRRRETVKKTTSSAHRVQSVYSATMESSTVMSSGFPPEEKRKR